MLEKRIDALKTKVKKVIKTIIKKRTVLFVCIGNTCRSAMAEQIFTNYLKDRGRSGEFYVESAGLSVTEDMMNVLAKEALASLQIKFSKHVPRQLDILSVTEAYRVVCMEQAHKDMIVMAVGDLPSIKTVDEITGRGDIPDPYGTDFNKYIETAKKLEFLCDRLYDDLIEAKEDDVEQEIEENVKPKKQRRGKAHKREDEDAIDVDEVEDIHPALMQIQSLNKEAKLMEAALSQKADQNADEGQRIDENQFTIEIQNDNSNQEVDEFVNLESQAIQEDTITNEQIQLENMTITEEQT